MNEVEPNSILQLREYFSKLRHKHYMGELSWYFDIRLFELEDSNTALHELISFAYPDASPEKAEITTSNFYDLRETLDYWFTTNFDGTPPKQCLIRGDRLFADLLDQCIDYQQAEIYQYDTQERLDPLGAGIIGNFTFIFLNFNQGRMLILSGGDCD